ncbi:MAG: hypothetical protein ACI9HK_002550 [Pirellulaceae bacterium]|jgi:hypothetical protein
MGNLGHILLYVSEAAIVLAVAILLWRSWSKKRGDKTDTGDRKDP